MAAKRTATSELNHDNWNDDAEPEDAGTFKKASEDVLKNRVIKTARRRKPLGSDDSNSTKNIFSGFSGFGKSTSQPLIPSSDSPFAFLKNMTNNPQNNKNGSNLFTSSSCTSIEINKFPMTFTSPSKSEEKPKENGTSTDKNNTETLNNEYFASLKGLNESVANWIKTHVDKNPLCILTPIFKDYEKYLEEIEDKKNKTPINTEISSENPPKVTEPTKIAPVAPVIKINEEKSPFASKPTLNFGGPLGGSSGFSFGTGAPFTFANVSKPPTEEKKSEEKEAQEEDEPPKVEFTPVVEEDHIFTKRCKVFVKKDGNFGDRGVGQLFLKPVSGSEKVQLIVRADTNLGNLLLNFILSESIPLQRMGKNNVMLVCIPTPEAKPPPVPVLLRVKTSDEADELLKILETNKK